MSGFRVCPDEFTQRILENIQKEIEEERERTYEQEIFVNYKKDKWTGESRLTAYRRYRSVDYEKLKEFEGEEADRVYNLLTGGM